MKMGAESSAVYLAHYVYAQPAISQKLVNARGTVTFQIIYLRRPDNQLMFLAPRLPAAEMAQCRALMQEFERLANVARQAGPYDALALAQANGSALSLAQMQHLQMIGEYTTAALIYRASVETYLASPAPQRISPNHTLDIYRQALGFHDLDAIRRLLDGDGAHFPAVPMTPHQRECLLDAMYQMARRVNLRERAFGFLRMVWDMRPSAARAVLLMDDAALMQDSDMVLMAGQYLDHMGQLKPRNLAQMVVAHQRLGQIDMAHAGRSQLSMVETEEGLILTQKMLAFLDHAAAQ
jgi:hypothetical protein